MNRFDEIKATALLAAGALTDDPAKRDLAARALVDMTSLMIEATAKGLACDGEANIPDSDDETAYARYTVGERMMVDAKTVARETLAADLERYARAGLTPSSLITEVTRKAEPCDVKFSDGSTCTRTAGHWTPQNGDVHTPGPAPEVDGPAPVTLWERLEHALQSARTDSGTIADLDDYDDVVVLATAVMPLLLAVRAEATTAARHAVADLIRVNADLRATEGQADLAAYGHELAGLLDKAGGH